MSTIVDRAFDNIGSFLGWNDRQWDVVRRWALPANPKLAESFDPADMATLRALWRKASNNSDPTPEPRYELELQRKSGSIDYITTDAYELTTTGVKYRPHEPYAYAPNRPEWIAFPLDVFQKVTAKRRSGV